MKNGIFSLFVFFAALAMFTTSCSDDGETIIIDSSEPMGNLSVERSGTFTPQNNKPTQGAAELGRDEDNVTFLRFSDDFSTDLATGTVTVYLSTSETFMRDPGNGNPDIQLLGAVSGTGEEFYRIEGGVDSKFTHVILWCDSVEIPFGFAPLQ